MKKILCIDDEADQVELVTSSLEKKGYVCISANDAEEGFAKASSEKPDLILLDLFLPNTNGFEVCSKLKQDPHTKDIPIIVVTGSGVEYVENQCKNAGADACIVKPYQLDGLVAEIKKVLKEL